MDLAASDYLKEVPDLSNATNLEILDLSHCYSLVEIPSSISHLHKLRELNMWNCINLQVIPAQMNLASLEWVNMVGCQRLRNIPVMPTNIEQLGLTVEDIPPSIRLYSRLTKVFLLYSGKLKGLTHLPKSVTELDLSNSDIERIPDCIKALHQLVFLDLGDCRRLTSLPELPGSLIYLHAENCVSLETVFFPLSTPKWKISFTNCIKLGQQARRGIIRRSLFSRETILPGREVPAEFDNRARGSSLTIVLDGNSSYKGVVFCVVLSPNHPIPEYYYYSEISWRRIIAQDDGYPVEDSVIVSRFYKCQTENLLIFHYRFPEIYVPEVNKEMMFEFSSKSLEIIECGAKILTQEESIAWEESIEWSYEYGSDQASEENTEYGEPTNIEGHKHTGCWSWLFLCFGLSDFVSGSGS